jgi:hypothetical protein
MSQMSLNIAKSPHEIIQSIHYFRFLTKLLGDGIGVTVTHTVIPQHGLIHDYGPFSTSGQQSKALNGIIK